MMLPRPQVFPYADGAEGIPERRFPFPVNLGNPYVNPSAQSSFVSIGNDACRCKLCDVVVYNNNLSRELHVLASGHGKA